MDYRAFAIEFINYMLTRKHAWKIEGVSDLPKGALGVLTFLYYHNNGASVGELTEYLQVTSGRTTALLQRLERRNLIQREQSTADKRVFFAFLTEEGRRQVESDYERMIVFFATRFEKLGEEDTHAYIRIIKKLFD